MINLSMAEPDNMLRPRISVVGVGGAGGNAINNMIRANLEGCDFIAANTDAQALAMSLAGRKLQLGLNLSRGLGAGSKPTVGCAAAEEQIAEIQALLEGCDMLFVTAGMGGGTGTGAAPVIARIARECGILTVGVVTKPFHFEGTQRMRQAEAGIAELQKYVDTLIVIPNQNLFRIANERTTIAEAFRMADEVLHSGVRGITDLMVMPGFMNLDFADVKTVMGEMGKAMMGTGEADGDNRAIRAAEAAISNPLLDDISMKGARGVLINVTGGLDMTLFEMDQAANRIREEVDAEAQIKVGSTLDENISGRIRVSVIATGIDAALIEQQDKARAAGTGGGSSGHRSAMASAPASAPSPVRVVASDTASHAAPQALSPAARAAAAPVAPAMPAAMPEVASRASVPVPPRNVTMGATPMASTSINLSTSYFTTQTPVAAQVVARHRMNESAQSSKDATDSRKEPDLLDTVTEDRHHQDSRDQDSRTMAAATAAMETMAELAQDDDLHDAAEDHVEMQEAVNAGSSNAGFSARRDSAPTARGNGYAPTPSPVASPASRMAPAVSRPASSHGSAQASGVTPARLEPQNAPRDMRMTQLTTGQNAAPTAAQPKTQMATTQTTQSSQAAGTHVNHRSQSLFQRITGFGIARPSASRDDDDFDDTPVAHSRAKDAPEADQADLLEIPAFLRRQTNH